MHFLAANMDIGKTIVYPEFYENNRNIFLETKKGGDLYASHFVFWQTDENARRIL